MLRFTDAGEAVVTTGNNGFLWLIGEPSEGDRDRKRRHRRLLGGSNILIIFNASPITGQCPIEEYRFGRGVTFPRKGFLRRCHHME